MNSLSQTYTSPQGTEDHTPHYIPTSVVQASRDEIGETPLGVQAFVIGENSRLQAMPSSHATLPPDLTGYYFVAAALSPPETQVINGDGMVYRIGFANGEVTLKTRIAKTPCYYADQITQRSRKYPEAYSFKDSGPTRASSKLGNRNQLNTAFLQTRDRLLLTFDAGIPWVIDPDSMELIEPVGRMDEWLSITTPFTGLAPSLQNQVFPTHSNPAHPVYDQHRPEADFPSCRNHGTETTPIDHLLTLNYSTGYKGKFRKGVDRFLGWVLRHRPGRQLGKNLPGTQRVYGFTDLIRYTFDDRRLERWQLVLPDWDARNPDVTKLVIGEQSIHQMVVTQDYIILVDMAFKIELSQIFSPYVVEPLGKLLDRVLKFAYELSRSQVSQAKLLEWRLKQGYKLYSFLLKLLPPSQITSFYIISRADLQKCSNNPGGTVTDSPKSIRVRKVTIPREVSHFTADYSNPDSKITLHIGHQNGTDVTEWISKYDQPVPGKEQFFGKNWEPCKRLAGMSTGAMDVSSFGRYIVDGETGALLESKVFSDIEHTWWPSVYTHRDICRDLPDESATEIKNLYWMCWGFSWEIIPDRIYQAYKDREFRAIHYTELPEKGKPCKLLRLNTQTMKIADWFDFPPGHFACSPQFIPKPKSTLCPDQDLSTHGYIVCVVLADAPAQAGTTDAIPRDEFWIFDANNLGNRQDQVVKEQAIVYKLSRSQALNLGLTIHSSWLSTEDFVEKSQAYHDPDIRQRLRRDAFRRDYGAFVEDQNNEHTSTDKPRSFKKIDDVTRSIFQEIQNLFIEQKLECSCFHSHSRSLAESLEETSRVSD